MVDMSHYEKEENLQLTKELTEYCHARGIITEAEPGRINGGEDGVAVSLPLRNRYHATWVLNDTDVPPLGHCRAGRHPHYP